ncbi:carbohydrate kinase family protein [Aureimonas frigidaquae]|uniref:carbohydrate kinase family protein n=1 Tax=Aureimonas frigidaquae TaxID=424757 RepID=UPI0007819131|nr:carbohydrate kinase [Aureimonas frigidaquae]
MFLSCGDALFDMFEKSEGGDPASVALEGRVGGSTLNVALGLSRLGHASAFFSKMSGDLFGRRIRAFMKAEGIDERFLIPTNRATTLAIVSLTPEGTPNYDFYIEGTADRSVEVADVPEHFPDELDAIHISSYSTVSEPTASALLHLIGQESGRRFISYDPNIRASVEPDLDIWRDRVARTLPKATLIKASEEDLQQIYPGRSLDSVLSDWIASGPALAVITRGENGALATTSGGHVVQVPGLPVTVVDTVGAGDTFQAATLARLKEDGNLSRAAVDAMSVGDVEAVIGFAIRAAAITCSRRGADLPRRADLGLGPLAA